MANVGIALALAAGAAPFNVAAGDVQRVDPQWARFAAPSSKVVRWIRSDDDLTTAAIRPAAGLWFSQTCVRPMLCPSKARNVMAAGAGALRPAKVSVEGKKAVRGLRPSDLKAGTRNWQAEIGL